MHHLRGWHTKILFEMFRCCHGHGDTLTTSNLPLNEWICPGSKQLDQLAHYMNKIGGPVPLFINLAGNSGPAILVYSYSSIDKSIRSSKSIGFDEA